MERLQGCIRWSDNHKYWFCESQDYMARKERKAHRARWATATRALEVGFWRYISMQCVARGQHGHGQWQQVLFGRWAVSHPLASNIHRLLWRRVHLALNFWAREIKLYALETPNGCHSLRHLSVHRKSMQIVASNLRRLHNFIARQLSTTVQRIFDPRAGALMFYFGGW